MSIAARRSMIAANQNYAGDGSPPPPSNDFTPFWGAAVGGNADPSPIETPAGRPLGVRRTYWNDQNSNNSITMATADIAAGRVPWPSYKVAPSWAEMAGGAGDAWFTDLCQQLNNIGGPVMLTIHHEPEGDGPIADWVAMQSHLYPLSQSYANIKFGPILTGWDTLNVAQYSFDALWPGQYDAGDFIGFDGYNEYGVIKNGSKLTGFTEMKHYYQPFGDWAAARGINWAVGEFGYSDDAAALDVDWIGRAYDDAVAQGGCLALSYFDSTLNSVNNSSWDLEDMPAKLDAYVAVLQSSIAPYTPWPTAN